MFGYKLFVSLSLKEVEDRRERLDQAGFTGWLSPILILVVLYLFRASSLFTLLGLRGRPGKPPKILILNVRRLLWSLSTPLPSDFGDIRTHLVGIGYGSWLLYIAIRGTSPDYMHLTKSLAHVTVSQLPIHYLLAFKSSQSPVQMATGLSHERLNAYHRLLGRIIHAMLASHAILYLTFFVQAGVLGKRIKDADVRLGVAAVCTLNTLGLLALPVVREKAYLRLFYRSHVILPATLLVLLWFHVRHTRIYVAQAALFWITNLVLRRSRSTTRTKAKIKTLNGTSLLQLSVPVNKSSALNDFVPGEHVYLMRSRYMLGPKTPFTIVDVEKTPKERHNDDFPSQLMLVVRSRDGPQTGSMRDIALELRDIVVSIEGPYGEAREYMPPFIQSPSSLSSNVLLVAGGVGAAYALPIYMALVKHRQSTLGVKFVWIMKYIHEASWGMDLLKNLPAPTGIEVYTTQKEIYDVMFTNGQKHDPAEVESQVTGLGIALTFGRPDFRKVVQEGFSRSNPSSAGRGVVSSQAKSPTRTPKRDLTPVFVGVCGPPSLAKAVRAEVSRHVYEYGREVEYHEEQFGFGSS